MHLCALSFCFSASFDLRRFWSSTMRSLAMVREEVEEETAAAEGEEAVSVATASMREDRVRSWSRANVSDFNAASSCTMRICLCVSSSKSPAVCSRRSCSFCMTETLRRSLTTIPNRVFTAISVLGKSSPIASA